jgi:chloramphenicol-sensitive protein RarD
MRRHPGMASAVSAYSIWGVLPLYFALLASVGYADIFQHRIVWSAIMLGGFLLLRGQAAEALRSFAQPRLATLVAVSGLLIGCNWLFYAYAVLHGQTLEASLAYFINPLLTALMARVVFAERLARYHIVALALGGAGVGWQLIFLDRVPWIALVLATTFAAYGLAKKKLALPAMQGLWLETLCLLPVLFVVEHLPFWQASPLFAHASHPTTMLLLIGLGLTTTVPLILFSQAAQRLPLVAMALLQYLSPSIKFLVAVLFLGEALSLQKLFSYILVWIGVGVFIAGTVASSRLKDASAARRDPI